MPGAAEKRKGKRESSVFTNSSSPGISKNKSWHCALARAVKACLEFRMACQPEVSVSWLLSVGLGHKPQLCAAFVCTKAS